MNALHDTLLRDGLDIMTALSEYHYIIVHDA